MADEEKKEEVVEQPEIVPHPPPPRQEKKDSRLFIGLDCGTMNICCARNDTGQIRITRNVFLPISDDSVSMSELSNISYVKSDDNELFIIGEDAFKFANIFGQAVSRPMEKGLISPREISAIDVLTLIVKDLVGPVKDRDVYCAYSIPAEAIDETRSVIYHTRVFGRILGALGVNHRPVNEGAAIIYSECSKERFSGVGISFGAGMCNVAIMYKGVEVLKFSTSRSGDYIDNSVSESLSLVPNRVTSIKERKLDLAKGFMQEGDKKIRRVIEALEYYYSALINYTIKKIINEFNEKVDIEVDESLPIIISGGTSMPNGFLELFKSTLSQHELPFGVSEVRRAKNPLTAVANGLLVLTVADFSGTKIKR
jgi:hypothetical protein